MGIAFIIIPIVLIVYITFDFIKAVSAGNEDTMKKNQKIVIKRIVYCLMVFMVMPIVNIVFSAFKTSGNEGLISADGVNYLSCWANADKVESIAALTIEANFDPAGGRYFLSSSQSCGGTDSCEIIMPNATKTGYIFKGWTKDGSSDLYQPGQKVTINRDDKFTANWEEKPEEEGVITDKDILDKDNESPIEDSEQKPNDGGTSSDSGGSTGDNNSNTEVVAIGFWWPIAPEDKDLAYIYSTNSPSHYGIDITSESGEKGVIDIIAAYDGEVIVAENDVPPEYDDLYGQSGATSSKVHDGYGNYVVIQHNYNGETLYTYYAHMTQDVKVKVGDKVVAGTVLGKMGSSGNSSGTHLHFEIRDASMEWAYKSSTDPLKFVKEGEYPS